MLDGNNVSTSISWFKSLFTDYVEKYPDLSEIYINGLGDDGVNRSFALK